ncbi:metabotropic glutamate receptor 1-like isoform X2 [Biomphalaria glabrata]|uniref:Metabotropic glutamate receptor 1-like isoform X2 n=1 Tax=Biomphalaria glabrata TaxID=6526 RepID=A0A9W3AAI2_BIOGL|nr:metabotropic glutamate receptor 1-like isoform X2 [Biomphalaria glabrata]KAI8728082.1 metabotropic glutamate receptor 5-like [Biomphalaria glabrata]
MNLNYLLINMSVPHPKVFYTIIILLAGLDSTRAYLLGDPSLNSVFKETGDLYLGALFSVTNKGEYEMCGSEPSIEFYNSLQIMEILAFSIRKVNGQNNILPEIKLGFVFLDFCSNVHTAMMQAKRFLPRSDPADYSPSNGSMYLNSYKVVGILESSEDNIAVPVSVVYGAVGLPVLRLSGSSGRLVRDPTIFSRQFRVSSTKMEQLSAMLGFLKYNNWTYLSIVLQADYLQYLQEDIYLKVQTYGMCVSQIIQVTSFSDYDSTILTLKAIGAKVVMLLTSSEAARLFMEAVNKHQAHDDFIFLVTSTWIDLMISGRLAKSFFLFTTTNLRMPNYTLALKNLKSNPWFPLALKKASCLDEDCEYDFITKRFQYLQLNKGNIYDAVFIFAHSLHNMIQEKCPRAKGKDATACFDANSLEFSSYLSNVSFVGASGKIWFDRTNNKKIVFKIYQNIFDVSNRSIELQVAYYDVERKRIVLSHPLNLNWINFTVNETQVQTCCQKPCAANAYKFRKGCCWLCYECQNNEKVAKNETTCERCPPFYWPAMRDGKLEVCEEMIHIQQDWTDPEVVVTLVIVALAISYCFLIFLLLVFKKDTQTDKHIILKYFHLVAVLMGFSSVPFFLVRVTLLTCTISLALYVMSFALEYGLLLVESLEVYRQCKDVINEKELKWTTPLNQFIFVVVIFTMEMIAFIVLKFIYPTKIVQYQPQLNVNGVETGCEASVPQTVTYLIFTIFFLALCLVITLKSQNDRMGAEHGRVLRVFVFLALVSWLVFIPVFFTAVSQRGKIKIRITAVLINHVASLALNLTPSYLIPQCVKRKDSVYFFGASWDPKDIVMEYMPHKEKLINDRKERKDGTSIS